MGVLLLELLWRLKSVDARIHKFQGPCKPPKVTGAVLCEGSERGPEYFKVNFQFSPKNKVCSGLHSEAGGHRLMRVASPGFRKPLDLTRTVLEELGDGTSLASMGVGPIENTGLLYLFCLFLLLSITEAWPWYFRDNPKIYLFISPEEALP